MRSHELFVIPVTRDGWPSDAPRLSIKFNWRIVVDPSIHLTTEGAPLIDSQRIFIDCLHASRDYHWDSIIKCHSWYHSLAEPLSIQNGTGKAYLNPSNILDKHLRTMTGETKQISRNINKRSSIVVLSTTGRLQPVQGCKKLPG